MTRILSGIMAAILFAGPAIAADDKASWQNLRRLEPGNAIEVIRSNGPSIKGDFSSFDDQALTLRVKDQNVTSPRAEVRQVRLRHKGRRALWIGVAVGAGGGLAAGAALGERLANESGGDFANLKGGIAAGCAAAGALIGALIGSVVGGRNGVVYQVK